MGLIKFKVQPLLDEGIGGLKNPESVVQMDFE